MLYKVLFLFFFWSSAIARAQFISKENFKFKTYTTQDGLVHNYTVKCRMDSKGFLWVITQNGISRFDGYEFINYQNNLKDTASLPMNELRDISIDSKDRIWLAYKNGLCYYDQAKHIFFRLNQNAVSLCYDSINNRIWFNNDQGLFAVNVNTMAVEKTSLQSKYLNTPVYTTIDSKQRIWISIEREGYYIYDIKKASFVYFEYKNWPRNIYEDDEKKIWITTWQNGLQQFDENKGANAHSTYRLHIDLPDDIIYQDATQSVPLTGTNIIWVATHTEGIAFFDKNLNSFTGLLRYDPSVKSGIPTNFNSSIYTDRNGVIWICTWKGLTKVNKQEQQFQSAELKYLQSFDYNLLSSIIDDPYNKNFAWLGVNGSGICYYDKSKQEPVKWFYRNNPGVVRETNNLWRWINNGIKDDYNNIWYSTNGGLIKIQKGTVSKIPITYKGAYTYPRKVKLLSDGYLWVCTRSGLLKYDPNSFKYNFYRVNNDPSSDEGLNDIIEINHEEILCAYSHIGLFIFNKKYSSFKRITSNGNTFDQSKGGIISSLAISGSNIFMGSSSGLLQYDITTGQISNLGREQEIFKVEMDGLITDLQGQLWIYTLHGLFRYNPFSKMFKKFTTADGIYDNSSDPVQLFQYGTDIFIGYRMAYTRFNPAQIDVNNAFAVPVISSVSINNQVLNEAPDNYSSTAIQLSYNENNLMFHYTAIDYTNTEKITFAYMLEGFDKDWISGGTARKVTYSNLKGGRYTFKLKACNSSGLWNEHFAAFNFYIRPPVWQRWWFWPLIALLFILNVVFIARKRVKAIRKKEEHKTAVNKTMAELETKMLRSQMNPHFIFNSLNSIQKYIWENKEEDAAEYLARFAKLIRAILENSRKEYISLGEEMDVMKLYIELEHRRSNGQFDYFIKADDLLDPEKTMIPPLIMQPFIENAIWHGLNKKSTRGKLMVSVLKQNNDIVCIIDDDGIGRQHTPESADIEKKSLGIDITQQRIHRLSEITGKEGSLVITDKKDNGRSKGTVVTITLPLQII